MNLVEDECKKVEYGRFEFSTGYKRWQKEYYKLREEHYKGIMF